MKQPLAIVRGTTNTITISVKNYDGSVYVLDQNEVLRFGVKRRPGNEALLFSKDLTSSDFSGDSYTLTINPPDTEGLDFGCYYYDVGLQSGSNYFNVIECSEFRVEHNITQREVN